MPEAVKPVPSYARWAEVPDHLRTRTQLAALDLPRQAAGPVRATIETRNPGTGRKDEFDLYDVRESVPTAATAAQLLSAGVRRTTNTRTCEDCGAHPETPCTPAADGRALCGTCAHITRLRIRQAEIRAAAQDVAETAARLLADEHLAAAGPRPPMTSPAAGPSTTSTGWTAGWPWSTAESSSALAPPAYRSPSSMPRRGRPARRCAPLLPSTLPAPTTSKTRTRARMTTRSTGCSAPSAAGSAAGRPG
ncbi:hypothetical protein ACGF0D_39785 [Kitasatospora sp. NPDC048298]|uniref:hypothetical protein n=1 Tax=Kitasatospora sp. NPDC048298 TaxID=3364049 RepID=UPI00371D9B0B